VTLAEALDPLYRNYLRRLEEMVGRLPPQSALTEQTTRDDDGRLVIGDDGLPVRFDVADARDGHTYEVHGSHPDAPAGDRVQVGRLDVRLEPGNWEELKLTCVFDGEPYPEDAEDLADLIRGFVIFGWYGGFAHLRAQRGTTEKDRWLGCTHSIKVAMQGNQLIATIDFGTAPPAAVEQLCAALSGYCQHRVPMAHLRIGG
jgi:hypothetical protein